MIYNRLSIQTSGNMLPNQQTADFKNVSGIMIISQEREQNLIKIDIAVLADTLIRKRATR